MTDVDLNSAYALACSMAAAARQMALHGQASLQASRKADGTEVTTVDFAIQEFILQRIAQEFPDHAVLAEEQPASAAQSPSIDSTRYCWIIDPLDGTRNFIRSFPCHATSIALLDGGRPVVGVVHEHLADLAYSVRDGSPPECNGRPMMASNRPFSRQSLVAVPSGRNEHTGPVIRAWLDETILRNTGSTAMHLALVAAGGLDAAYCRECHVWDVAAGWLLVTSAGGVCSDLAGASLFPMDLSVVGRSQTPFLAGSRQSHAALLKTLM